MKVLLVSAIALVLSVVSVPALAQEGTEPHRGSGRLQGFVPPDTGGPDRTEGTGTR